MGESGSRAGDSVVVERGVQIQFAQDSAGLAGLQYPACARRVAVPCWFSGSPGAAVLAQVADGQQGLAGAEQHRDARGPRPGRNLVIDAAGGEVRDDGEGFPAAGGNAGQHRQAVRGARGRRGPSVQVDREHDHVDAGVGVVKVQRRAKPVLERHAADRSHAAIHRVGRLNGASKFEDLPEPGGGVLGVRRDGQSGGFRDIGGE